MRRTKLSNVNRFFSKKMTSFIHIFGLRGVFCVRTNDNESIGARVSRLFNTKGINSCENDFYISCNGLLIDNRETIREDVVYTVAPRIPGGKGGFGSMLRAIGAQIEKTTNHEACRDLSGRRMRDVNNEKDLKDWLGKQAEKEKERERKRQEKVARRRAMPNHKFDDPMYDQQKAVVAESLEDALQQGLQKTSKPGPSASATCTSSEADVAMVGFKRKAEETATRPAKVRKETEWLGLDIDTLSGIDSDEESEDAVASVGAETSESVEQNSSDSKSVVSSENSNDSFAIGNPKKLKNFCCAQDPVVQNIDRSCEPSPWGSSVESDDSDSRSSVSNSQGIKSKEEIREAKKTHGLLSALDSLKKSPDSGQGDSVEDLTDKIDDKGEKRDKDGPLNLEEYESVSELEQLGLERLKSALIAIGLKCGGTLQERAARLFAVRGLAQDQIDPSLFAKASKNKKKK